MSLFLSRFGQRVFTFPGNDWQTRQLTTHGLCYLLGVLSHLIYKSGNASHLIPLNLKFVIWLVSQLLFQECNPPARWGTPVPAKSFAAMEILRLFIKVTSKLKWWRQNPFWASLKPLQVSFACATHLSPTHTCPSQPSAPKRPHNTHPHSQPLSAGQCLSCWQPQSSQPEWEHHHHHHLLLQLKHCLEAHKNIHEGCGKPRRRCRKPSKEWLGVQEWQPTQISHKTIPPNYFYDNIYIIF